RDAYGVMLASELVMWPYNVSLMPWPIENTVSMIAKPISAAIKPYSIAVAPRRSATKRASRPRTERKSEREGVAKEAMGQSYFGARVWLQQGGQVRDERQVGGRHRILLEPVRPHPGEPLALQRGRDPVPPPTYIERHQQVEVRVGVAREGERREASF